MLNRDDLKRLEREYQSRDAKALATGAIWSAADPAIQYLIGQRSALLQKVLADSGLNLSTARLLDIGCGGGYEMDRFQQFGFREPNIFGIDYLHSRVQIGHDTFPALSFTQADGSRLPFPDGAFDVVTQFTAFSAIQDKELKAAMAAEMWRAVRPGGFLIWYDMRPLAPSVTRLGRAVHFIKRNLKSPTDIVRKAQSKLSKRMTVESSPVAATPPTTVIPIPESEMRAYFPLGEVVCTTTGLYFALVDAFFPLGEKFLARLEHASGLHTHLLATIRKSR